MSAGVAAQTVSGFAAELAAENKELRAQADALEAALTAMLAREERNTCTHDSTHRGGFLWTICDECGAKWADDEGGKPDWADPDEWQAARSALSAYRSGK